MLREHLWMILGLTVLIGSLCGVYKLFRTYYEIVGPGISYKHEAWSSFGSLLSGVFTLFGSAATIATLIFLSRQFREQQKTTAKQIESLTFDQYLNHRGLFVTRLGELEKLFPGQIKFRNPEKLYGLFFPRNNPTFCEFKVDFEGASEGLKSVSEDFQSFPGMLDGKLDDFEVLDIVERLGGLSTRLGIEYIYEEGDGDIYFAGVSYGVNIYSLDIGISRLYEVYNSLLFFTGNSRLNVSDFLGGDVETKFWVLKFYSRASARMEPSVSFVDPDLHSMHKVYVLVQEYQSKESVGDAFILLRRYLDQIFSTAVTVAVIGDKTMLNKLVDEAIKEVRALLTEIFKCLEIAAILEDIYAQLKLVDIRLFEEKMSRVPFGKP